MFRQLRNTLFRNWVNLFLLSVLTISYSTTSLADDFQAEEMDDIDFDRVIPNDFDNDGDMDFILYEYGKEFLHLFVNKGIDDQTRQAKFAYLRTLKLSNTLGSGSFWRVPEEIIAVAIGDVLENDLYSRNEPPFPELVILNEKPDKDSIEVIRKKNIFREDRPGEYSINSQIYSPITLRHDSESLVLVDVNNDGKPELLTTKYEEPGVVLYYDEVEAPVLPGQRLTQSRWGSSRDISLGGKVDETLDLLPFVAYPPLLPDRFRERDESSVQAVLSRDNKGWINGIFYVDTTHGVIVTSEEAGVEVSHLNRIIVGEDAHANRQQGRLAHVAIGDFMGKKESSFAFVFKPSDTVVIGSYFTPPKKFKLPNRVDDMRAADVDGDGKDELLVAANSRLYVLSGDAPYSNPAAILSEAGYTAWLESVEVQPTNFVEEEQPEKEEPEEEEEVEG